MKPTLLLTVLLLAPALAYTQAWPLNPQTGKLELHGKLPWPTTVKTEAQRRQLIRRWYFAKLTEETPTESRQTTKRAASFHEKLTYDRLPQLVYYTYQPKPVVALRLLSEAQLTSTETGLVYRLTNFEVSWHEDDVSGGFPLEAQPKLSTDDQRALALLRKRLTQALTSW